MRGLVSPARQSFSACEQVALQEDVWHHTHSCLNLHGSPRFSLLHVYSLVIREAQKPGNRLRHCTSLAVCEAENVIPPLVASVPGAGRTRAAPLLGVLL